MTERTTRPTNPARRLIGRLTLWLIKTWVLVTGRVVQPDDEWLDGFASHRATVGPDILYDVIEEHHLLGERSEDCGLMRSFTALAGPSFEPLDVHPGVHHFYEKTARYELGCTPAWVAGIGTAARAFIATACREMDQCNLPLDEATSCQGMTNEVVKLRRREDGAHHASCWLRRSKASGDVVYAGFYGIAKPPLAEGPCVKVSFPLPGGYACVSLRPTAHRDGSFELVSHGDGYGDAGFYLVYEDGQGGRKARRIPLHESIRVGVDENGEAWAKHRFEFLTRFLELDYDLARRQARGVDVRDIAAARA